MSDLRGAFEVPPGGPYLLAHSVGALPRAARAGLETAVLAPWSGKGGDAWGDWLGAIDGFRDALAGLLGGTAADYCPQPNLSAGLFRLLSALPPEGERREILASDQSFASIGFALKGLEALGFRLRLLTVDPTAVETWAEAIGPQTAAVVAMHVHSNSSAVGPIAEIAALAREAGAIAIVDVAQSAGVLPLNLPTLGVDGAIGSCVKWLCGGPGAGWLWVSPTLCARAKPIEIGWFSHVDPFEFDIRDFRYAPDARRFWGGTPSVAPYALAAAAIGVIAGVGVEAVRAHNRALIARVSERTNGRWFDPDRSGFGGTICIAAEGSNPSLTAIGAKFDRRGDQLRLSFHVYNTADEADRVAEALARV
ncbi:aminotransferase class V-fold PLP-dependent enzyme [Caulobacter mirabilis]|uniref:Aminotransferase V n=1 Tax=Caulobacter mirabilis TaxID=69666 RepID=A0A2D2AWA6_9CAUL|nr:aminotransferase class V-fold PLP-dependent enzyme [Caulobacter mirabilis]ATQ42255.1 aminotransferase V [Caulobacter mirabilis]